MAINKRMLAKAWLELVKAGRKQEADVPDSLLEEYNIVKAENA
jgi:hypothetical protein